MKIRAFITHKLNEKFSDCQDRFSVNPATKSVAIADGMSQSIFQKQWAQLLVEEYVKYADWVPNEINISELSTSWHQVVKENIEEQKSKGIDPYRAENMLNEGKGAGATLVGLRFDDNKWQCDVLGDSSLVEINAMTGEVVNIFSSRGDVYDNYPDYLDSLHGDIRGEMKLFNGELTNTSILLMVSDPFAEYINRKKQTNISLNVNEIRNLTNHEQYETLVAEWRKQGMHNDDSTLIIIENDDSADFNMVCEDCIMELISSENRDMECLLENARNMATAPMCADSTCAALNTQLSNIELVHDNIDNKKDYNKSIFGIQDLLNQLEDKWLSISKEFSPKQADKISKPLRQLKENFTKYITHTINPTK